MSLPTTTTRTSTDSIKVLILGSGFGAMHTALQLSKLRKKHSKQNIKVTLLSNVDYFWLVTMAHEVATGNLLPTDVMQPLRSLPISIFDDFIQGSITAIDVETKQVSYNLVNKVESNVSIEQTEDYDYLVSALGSQVNYFGVEGAKDFSFPMKTLPDVKAIKNQVLQCFEDAEFLDDPKKILKLLSFVIVGGGATGVEIAGELGDLINTSFKKRFPRVVKYASITIIHGGPKIGVPGQDWMTPKLEAMLQHKHCVKIICDSFVTRVTENGAWVGEQLYPSRSVIWSGGVQASKVVFKDSTKAVVESIKRDKAGRIFTNKTCQLADFETVFVIGDQAAVPDQSDTYYPMRAQFAVRQGELVAHNILAAIDDKALTDFNYSDKGIILSLGDQSAIASVGNIHITGKLAYWLYHIIYIPQIIGIRAKFRTLFDWTMNLFLPRDLSRL